MQCEVADSDWGAMPSRDSQAMRSGLDAQGRHGMFTHERLPCASGGGGWWVRCGRTVSWFLLQYVTWVGFVASLLVPRQTRGESQLKDGGEQAVKVKMRGGVACFGAWCLRSEKERRRAKPN